MRELVFGLAGLVIGVTAGILVQQPRTQPGRAFAERCRTRYEFVQTLPAAEREAFLNAVMANERLREGWSIIYACSSLRFDDEHEK